MLYTLLIATINQFVHHRITSVTDSKSQMMHAIAMLLDELIVGARIIVYNLVELDESAKQADCRTPSARQPADQRVLSTFS